MKSRLFKVAAAFAGVLLLLIALLVARALTAERYQVAVEPTNYEALSGAAERLARGVRFETVSHADTARMNMDAFADYNELLVTEYPRANAAMERELVKPCSVIYTWPGKDESLAPVLFAAHTDVVPVEPHEREQWTHGPFSGAVADGAIWGRGTLDDKIAVQGLMEGAELLATNGHVPIRTLVFAFGCDEEVGGTTGAKQMAAMFAERGQRFDFAFDEGLAIVDGYVPGLPGPAALVGIVEKGFATFRLTVETDGGHSSMPARESAIGVLSKAITKLEENRMPAGLNPASEKMFQTLAPEMDFGLKLVMTNLWLLEPVLVAQLAAQPATNASVRTTTAVTMMNAGVQDNVLAKKAVAKVNFRLAPGDSIEDVRTHVVETIDDERVEVVMQEGGGFGNPASKISEVDTDAFRLIRDSIRATFGNDVTVAPGSTTGGTDVRHYEDVSQNQYRFAPLMLRKESKDTGRIHGVDERITIENYRQAVAFYAELLSRL